MAAGVHVDGQAGPVARLRPEQVQDGRHLARDVRLAPRDEGRRAARVVDADRRRLQHEAVVFIDIIRSDGVVDMDPFRPESVAGDEVVVLRRLRHRGLRERRDPGHIRIDPALAVHDRPGVPVPADRRKAGLAAQDMVDRSGAVAETQEHHPPGAVRRLDEVGVAGPLQEVAGGDAALLGQDRVAGVAGIGAADVRTAGDVDLVAHLRAALGDQQVVVAVLLVEVRALGAAVPVPFPDYDGRRLQLESLRVELGEPDAVHRPDQVHLPVFPEERGVDARHAVDEDRVAPGTGRILRRHDEIALSAADGVDVGRDHIEFPVVVADRRGEDAAARAAPAQVDLGRTVQDIADLLPVDQITAVEDRHTREILEGAVDQVEIIPDTADARIGVIARNHGVHIALGRNAGIEGVVLRGRGGAGGQQEKKGEDLFHGFSGSMPRCQNREVISSRVPSGWIR